MSRSIVALLIVVNVALAGTLALRIYGGSVAQAQTRRPPDVLMIPATAQGVQVGVVYVLDSANGELGAVAADNKGKIEAMPKINLNTLFDAALRASQPAGARGR